MEEAQGWRSQAAAHLEAHGFDAYSPLRGKDYLNGEEEIDKFAQGADPEAIRGILSSPAAIIGRDHWDVKRADLLLVNCEDTERVSIGTVMELAFAYIYHIPVVAVLDENHDHPFTRQCVTHLCPDLATAIAIIERFV
jgi:nucleoside 2-deoxyribosyltransferase